MRNLPQLFVTLAAVGVAVGCTTISSGDPKPADTSSAPEPTGAGGDDLPTNGAPRVEKPLDVSEYEEDPCKVLTAQQAQDLNAPESERDEDEVFGPACRWRSSEVSGDSFSAVFFTEDGTGLSSVYRDNENGYLAYFAELPDIEGHPAVAYDTKDAAPTVICYANIGLSDQLAFSVRASLGESAGTVDPCQAAATVAGMMMKNMKGE